MENSGRRNMTESGDGDAGEDPKKNLKKKLHIALIILFAVLVVRAYIFPTLEFNGSRIPTFTYGKLLSVMGWPNPQLPKGVFDATVLGSHVLETEYGEIRLEIFARIEVTFDSIWRIDFRKKRVSHSLVVEGIEIPQNSAVFLGSGHPGRIELHKEEVTVSNIPLAVSSILINSPKYKGDVTIIFLEREYVTLTDGTQIHFIMPSKTGQWPYRELNIYADNRPWEIDNTTFVKLPGETEFTRYKSITFEPDWGAFISGELLEEE